MARFAFLCSLQLGRYLATKIVVGLDTIFDGPPLANLVSRMIVFAEESQPVLSRRCPRRVFSKRTYLGTAIILF